MTHPTVSVRPDFLKLPMQGPGAPVIRVLVEAGGTITEPDTASAVHGTVLTFSPWPPNG